MGIFDKFKRPKVPEVIHPFFGRIVYQGDNVWELGRATFSPIGHEVEVIIHAGASGPEESHLRFWSDLEERWPTLKKECEPFLRSALKDWIDAVEREDLWSRLDVEALDVFPNIAPNEWEITFWCEEAGHWPTVSMKGWSPEGCYIDG